MLGEGVGREAVLYCFTGCGPRPEELSFPSSEVEELFHWMQSELGMQCAKSLCILYQIP